MIGLTRAPEVDIYIARELSKVQTWLYIPIPNKAENTSKNSLLGSADPMNDK